MFFLFLWNPSQQLWSAFSHLNDRKHSTICAPTKRWNGGNYLNDVEYRIALKTWLGELIIYSSSFDCLTFQHFSFSLSFYFLILCSVSFFHSFLSLFLLRSFIFSSCLEVSDNGRYRVKLANYTLPQARLIAARSVFFSSFCPGSSRSGKDIDYQRQPVADPL